MVHKYRVLPEDFTDVDRSSAQEEGEEAEDMKETWTPASRTTQADEEGNKRAIWRKLDRRLFLLVRNKQSKAWEFPSVDHADGETIRATAERNMQLTAGDTKCYFVGNAPCGHFARPSGDTQFFSKVQVLDIQKDISLANTSGADDFVWVTSDEVCEFIEDKGLQDLCRGMLSP